MSRTSRYLILLALPLLLSACADVPKPSADAPETEAVNDPFESVNRSIFDRYIFIDRLIFRPLAELYRATIPPGIRDRVAGVLGNMKEPVIFMNNVMQGEFGRAGTTFERFGINTTLGIGGMWDWAGDWGMSQQTGDFGQTLASWGVGEGPYLMVPLLGPSDVRDALGRGVDFFLSPWQYLVYMDGTDSLIKYETTSFTTDLLVRREQNIEKFDILRAGSMDPYATVRSAYLQHRRKQLGIQEKADFEDYK